MFPVFANTYPHIEDINPPYLQLPLALGIRPDLKLYKLLESLTDDKPWAERKSAAQGLGRIHHPLALQGLLAALPNDPFWMVRCAIIQAIEYTGNPRAIPTLQDVAKNDSFEAVRSHAAKAIKSLSEI